MISTLELTKAGSQKEGSHYGATKGSDATEGPPADATCSEKFRDNLFAFLDGPFVFKLMMVLLSSPLQGASSLALVLLLMFSTRACERK